MGGAALIGAAGDRTAGSDPPGDRNGHGTLGDIFAGLRGLLPAGAAFDLFLQAHHGLAQGHEDIQALRGMDPPPHRAALIEDAQIQPAGAICVRRNPHPHYRGMDGVYDRVVSQYTGQARHTGDTGGESGGGDFGIGHKLWNIRRLTFQDAIKLVLLRYPGLEFSVTYASDTLPLVGAVYCA